MLLQRFSQTLRVSIALIVAVFSAGILPAATAYANHGTGQPQDVSVSEPVVWGQQGREYSDPECVPSQTSLFHYILAPSGTSLDSAGAINVTFTTGSSNDDGELSAGDGGAGHYYVSAPYDATASAATVTGASWTTSNHNPQTPILTLSGSECVGAVSVNGSLVISTDCEEITFSAGAITPTDGTVTFTLDGDSVAAGTHEVEPGEHTIVMSVNGTVVDTQVRIIDECENGTPTGSLVISTDCEEITFSAGAITPTDGTVTFTLDGVSKTAGTYTVTPGEHTVVMSVNGTVVDTEVRTIAECEENIEKYSICHAIGMDNKDGYVFIKKISAAGIFNGHLDNDSGGTHGDHQNGEDIIPPFEFRGQTYSQNWDTEGQAIYENDCVKEDEPVLLSDIDYTVVCVPNGVKVTLTNSGDASGSATVNGTMHTVAAGASKEVTLPFDSGTPFQTALTVTIDGQTSNQTVNCSPGRGQGQVLSSTTTSGGQGQGQVLGAALPETLPSTGGEANPLMIIVAALLAYGAAYFLQGRRLLGRSESFSA